MQERERGHKVSEQNITLFSLLPLKLIDIILESLRANLLLFKETEKYRVILAARIVALIVLLIVGIGVQQVLVGRLSFDMNFVLSIFAIFISWLFFWTADRSNSIQMTELRHLLDEFRKESKERISGLEHKLDNAFVGGELPPAQNPVAPQPPGTFAPQVAAMMKKDTKQILIALGQVERPINESWRIDYEFEFDNELSKGFTMFSSLRRELVKVGLIAYDATNDTVSLTPAGREFIKWLDDNGQRALYFQSPLLGSWGSPSPRFIKWQENEEQKEA